MDLLNRYRLALPKGNTVRRWIAQHLIFLADRIDPEGAFRCTGMSFTFERGIGALLNKDKDRGCPLWYRGHADYERAHNESITMGDDNAES